MQVQDQPKLRGKENGLDILMGSSMGHKSKRRIVTSVLNNLPQPPLWPKSFIIIPCEKDTHFQLTLLKVSCNYAIIFKVWVLHLVQIIYIHTQQTMMKREWEKPQLIFPFKGGKWEGMAFSDP